MKGNSILPYAIVVAAIIIGGAIMFTNKGSSSQKAVDDTRPTAQVAGDPTKVKPVTSEDHIFGNPDAPVKIVEFSDLECPFCAKVHPEIKKVIDESGGQIAWVYRHFPLTQIHKSAEELAVASECVAKIGGNDSFWSFVDIVFLRLPVRGTDSIVAIANEIGVDGEEVRSCISGGELNNLVSEDIADAVATGGRGTPHNIVVGPNGEAFAISGAQPASVFKQVADQILKSGN